MAQISSNTLTYDQIYLKIREFYIKEMRGEFGSNEDRLQEYKKLVSDIHESMIGPMTKFDPFIKGEPPMSTKFNTFANSLGADISLISKQVDYLNAKAVNAFNLYSAEVEAEKRYVERVSSKAKILQMYSKAPSEDLIYIGDTFDNSDFIDVNRIPLGMNPNIKDGKFTLPISKSRPWIPKTISIDTVYSNGFMGNNHQVIKDLNPTNTSEYDYVYQSSSSIASISSITDANPLTYFEYEGINLDRSSSVPQADSNLISEDEFCYVANKKIANGTTEGSLVNWSNFNMDDPLKLRIVLENPSSSMANNIRITPYFGSSKLIKINKIKGYKQNGETVELIQKPVYIGSSFAPLNLEMSQNYYYNEAVIKFTELKITKFEIDFEQEVADDIRIKHAFFKPSFAVGTGQNNPFYGLSRFNPSALSSDLFDTISYDRNLLVPSLERPNEYKNSETYVPNPPPRVSLKPKPTTYNEYAIVFKGSKNGSTTLETFYYYNGGKDPAIPLEAFNIANSPEGLYTSDPSIISANGARKTFPSVEDGQSEYDNFIAYLDAEYLNAAKTTSNGENTYSIIIGSFTYDFIISDINIEQVSYTNSPTTTQWTVPVSLNYELYNSKRKSIGIRDISVSYEVYADRTQIVSTPYYFESSIESLMLSVESTYDNTFIDKFEILYYISVNDSSWIQVSPIQLSSNGIAEVLVFNRNIPLNYQIPGVAYLNYPEVSNEINKVAVKIDIAKERYVNITPEVYSYQLMAKVKKQ